MLLSHGSVAQIRKSACLKSRRSAVRVRPESQSSKRTWRNLEDAPGSEPGGPKGLWGFDSLRPHSIKRVWRSWQTRRSEGPVEVILRVGSTPTTRTMSNAWHWRIEMTPIAAAFLCPNHLRPMTEGTLQDEFVH